MTPTGSDPYRHLARLRDRIDRLFEAAVVTGADAAHVDVGVYRRICDVQVGYVVSQRTHVLDAGVLDLFALYSGYRDRYVLKVFRPLLRGYDHFFKLLGLGECTGGCQGYSGNQRRLAE